jgi:lipopolysaccharide export system protein LptA
MVKTTPHNHFCFKPNQHQLRKSFILPVIYGLFRRVGLFSRVHNPGPIFIPTLTLTLALTLMFASLLPLSNMMALDIESEGQATLDHKANQWVFMDQVRITEGDMECRCDYLSGHYHQQPHELLALHAKGKIIITQWLPAYIRQRQITGDQLTIDLDHETILLSGDPITLENKTGNAHIFATGLYNIYIADHPEQQNKKMMISGGDIKITRRSQAKDTKEMKLHEVISGQKIITIFKKPLGQQQKSKGYQKTENTLHMFQYAFDHHLYSVIEGFHYRRYEQAAKHIKQQDKKAKDDIKNDAYSLIIKAKTAKYNQQHQTLLLQGNVMIQQAGNQMQADTALYDMKHEKITLNTASDGKIKIKIPLRDDNEQNE